MRFYELISEAPPWNPTDYGMGGNRSKKPVSVGKGTVVQVSDGVYKVQFPPEIIKSNVLPNLDDLRAQKFDTAEEAQEFLDAQIEKYKEIKAKHRLRGDPGSKPRTDELTGKIKRLEFIDYEREGFKKTGKIKVRAVYEAFDTPGKEIKSNLTWIDNPDGILKSLRRYYENDLIPRLDNITKNVDDVTDPQRVQARKIRNEANAALKVIEKTEKRISRIQGVYNQSYKVFYTHMRTFLKVMWRYKGRVAPYVISMGAAVWRRWQIAQEQDKAEALIRSYSKGGEAYSRWEDSDLWEDTAGIIGLYLAVILGLVLNINRKINLSKGRHSQERDKVPVRQWKEELRALMKGHGSRSKYAIDLVKRALAVTATSAGGALIGYAIARIAAEVFHRRTNQEVNIINSKVAGEYGEKAPLTTWDPDTYELDPATEVPKDMQDEIDQIPQQEIDAAIQKYD